MDKVAVVILNWNGKAMLEKYLAPLVKHTPKFLSQNRGDSNNFVSIIIADNNSTDGSIEWLQDNYPSLQTIILDKNYGFTGGYNRALKQVQAEYFILLNSDILVPDNWLHPLISFMDSNKKVGICQPKMLSLTRHLEIIGKENMRKENGESVNGGTEIGEKENMENVEREDLSGRGKEEFEEFEYAGAAGGFIDKWGFPFCRGRVISTIEKDKGQYDNAMRVFWASGACMVVRSSVWKDLGGLDESFFAHMEEIDFCWRAQLSGYEVWAVPQSKVYHLGGGTLPNNSPRKLFLNYRNNLLMLYKNLPIDSGWDVFGYKTFNRNFFIFTRMCIDALTAVVYFLQGKFSFVGAVYKAHCAFREMKKDAIITQKDNSRTHKPVGIAPFSIIFKKILGVTVFSKLLKNF